MKEEYYIGQIFEEIYPPEAASWCCNNNAKIVELEPEKREVEETYTEQVPVENEIVVPAEYDNDGNVIVEEHTETITEYEEQEKTRIVEVTVRRFEIVAIPEPLPPTEEELKVKVRMERNYLLSETDYTQLPDAPITEEDRAKYREYRQYLRDYTEQEKWWLQNPDDYQTWLLVYHPAIK